MPRYSIVLPTVDRPEILRATLTAALAIPRQDIEFVVSDNHSDQRTADVLSGFADARLRVLRTDHRMPMPDHWEWIWPQLSGDYIVYTGDDSVLIPGALDAADRAIDGHQADIVSWRCASYYHPDWNIRFRHLPSRGNILSLDPGFTHALHRVDTTKVIEHFCSTLRLSGGFPSVVNFLVRRELGDRIASDTGRFHWAPCPDISASLMAMTAADEGRYIYWDGIGAIGGRSGNSNIASLLSRGKASKRLREWLDEFESPGTRFPMHDIHLESITNLLAAAISQTKGCYPDRFPDADWDLRTLVDRSIDDAYSDLTVPWADDPTFIAQLEAEIAKFEPAEQAEITAHLEKSRAFMREQLSDPEYHFNPTPPPHAGGFLKILRALRDDTDGRSRRLFRLTGRDPSERFWSHAGSTFVDMALFGGGTIADAAKHLPTILREFGEGETGFATAYRENGMLSETLDSVG